MKDMSLRSFSHQVYIFHLRFLNPSTNQKSPRVGTLHTGSDAFYYSEILSIGDEKDSTSKDDLGIMSHKRKYWVHRILRGRLLRLHIKKTKTKSCDPTDHEQ